MTKHNNILSRISASQYLLIITAAVVVLTCANSLYNAVRYEMGFRYRSFLFERDDRFADIIKIGLSFKSFTSQVADSNGLDKWDDVYKTYYLSDIYSGVEGLSKGKLSHFHFPPLSELIFALCGIMIAATMSPTFVLYVAFAAYLLAVFWMISTGMERLDRTKVVLFATLSICLLSYPALLVFVRGNYNAGFTSLMIVTFMLALFRRGDAGFAALLSLAIAVNIRPNAIIFALALPAVLGLKRSLKPFVHLAGLAFAVFALSYVFAHALYPDYTLSTFLQGLRVYRDVYVAGTAGDVINSSLFAFVKNLNTMTEAGMNYTLVIAIFYALSAIVVVAAVICVRFAFDRKIITPFVLSALYVLLTPVFADYHLLVFLAPILLLFFSFQEWSGQYKLISVITFACVMVIVPKNYIFGHDISLQTLFNPAILFVSVLYIAWASFKQAMGLDGAARICGSQQLLS